MASKKAFELALSAALTTGGDFAEIFFEDTRRTRMNLIDGKIENFVAGREHGAGVRVYKGLNSVYVHTNDTSEAGMCAAARSAADAIGSIQGGREVHLVQSVIPNLHAFREIPMDIPGASKADLLHAAYAAAKGYSPLVSQVSAGIFDWDADITIANSEGLLVSDRRVYSRIAINAVASENGENQTGSRSPGALRGYELFRDFVNPEEEARKAAESAVTMLKAENCPAGIMPVVIDGGFGGVIFHEACGHSLEATSVAFGNSEFCGKLGEKIASDCVTAIDDGTMANEWGSTNIDDEGNPTTRLVLIENGILKNYMIDRLNSRRMNMPVTGSGRRESYCYAPTSRMRNTFIAAGNDDEAEIIRTMGDGLYAKQMGGGSVNPATGEFNFSVAEGYLVKDGKIDRPVRGATLIGKGGEVLKRIDRVGKKMWMAQGMCGSQSGSVPTNVGQPMIRVTSMTVGGR
ncbi:MAG: TldD/PmbA family protein [Clostridiales bacterium]|nr:TldD/PmbA family protein [Clostridiales bacterium]